MTEVLLPRLALADAVKTLEEVRRSAGAGQIHDCIRFTHHRAAASPTGGVAISQEELRALRQSVLVDLSTVRSTDDSVIGASIGKALETHLRVSPSDAAHFGGWAFLSLCVFPDIVYSRWPDFPEDRWIGAKRDRNYLRTSWRRYRALGDVIFEGDPSLREDELVGLLERTAMARNRSLVRTLAREILAYRGADRTDFARQLLKRVMYWTGASVVDLWNEETIRLRVAALARDVVEGT